MVSHCCPVLQRKTLPGKAENRSLGLVLGVSYKAGYGRTMKKPNVKRSEDQTTLTISLSKDLKERISEAAQADHRAVSPWCVLRLTEVLNAMDAEDAVREKRRSVNYRDGIGGAALRVADEPVREEGNGKE